MLECNASLRTAIPALPIIEYDKFKDVSGGGTTGSSLMRGRGWLDDLHLDLDGCCVDISLEMLSCFSLSTMAWNEVLLPVLTKLRVVVVGVDDMGVADPVDPFKLSKEPLFFGFLYSNGTSYF